MGDVAEDDAQPDERHDVHVMLRAFFHDDDVAIARDTDSAILHICA